MGRGRRQIVVEPVFKQRNVELGIAPYCQECISHGKNPGGYIKVLPQSWDGYGLMHRFIFAQENPDWDGSTLVMHLCDNPACIAPAHLKKGTPRDNSDDSIVKGRADHAKTARAASAVARRIFTIEETKIITKRHSAGESYRTLALQFSASPSTIRNICKGRFYAAQVG